MKINSIQTYNQRTNFSNGFRKVPDDLRIELLQDQSNNVFKNTGIAATAGLTAAGVSALYYAKKKISMPMLSKKMLEIGFSVGFLTYLITQLKDSHVRAQKVKNYYANSKN